MYKKNTLSEGTVRAALVLSAAALCAWLAFLLFQTGHVWDEAEHAHAAWLMSQGKRPLYDFFQHHQPMLWDLLSIYYRVGFDGAGVLIWGRVLVVLCGLTSVWALLSLGKESTGKWFTLAGITAVAALIATTAFLPALFVSRPETLSIAFITAALAMWNRDCTSKYFDVLVAGVLAGAACYASPRFVLFGGFFLVLGTHKIHRWVLLLTGGVLFTLVYTLLTGFPLQHVIFNLQFSAQLQSVGDYAAGPAPDFWITFAVAVIIPLLPLLASLDARERLRGLLLVANLLLVFLACHKVAGMFRYQQAYAPFAAGIAVTVAWLLAHYKPAEGRKLVLTAATVALAAVTVGLLRVSQPPLQFTLMQEIRDRDRLAAMVPEGRTVLLYTRKHPIAVADASYYGSPLFDARDRLCRAIRDFQGALGLPRCDYLADIQTARPYLLDTWIERATSLDDMPALKQRIKERYLPVTLPDLPLIRQGILMEAQPDAGY